MKNLKFGSLDAAPNVRRVKDMKDVILDKEWAENNLDLELYYMYRDLFMDEDRESVVKYNLRYDITVIPPLSIGREYVKTMGHYHSECSPGFTYPEIYEVLDGRAHFLLQKVTGGRVDEVVLIEAKAGEKAIMYPNYGHITINPGTETLKMANWVSREFSSVYEDFVRLGGGAYYELVEEKFIKNTNYRDVPPMKRVEVTNIPELGIVSGVDMYSLIREPQKLHFLNYPQDYNWVF